PAEVVQLIADVGHVGAVDHLGVGARVRVDVNRRQVVGVLNAGTLVECSGVELLLRTGLHRVGRRGVARPMVLVGRVVGAAHGSPSLGGDTRFGSHGCGPTVVGA